MDFRGGRAKDCHVAFAEWCRTAPQPLTWLLKVVSTTVWLPKGTFTGVVTESVAQRATPLNQFILMYPPRSFLTGCCFIAVCSATAVFASETAYDALKVAAGKLGRDSQNRVLEVVGSGGRPQPAIWQITVEDAPGRSGAAGVQQVDVRSGAVVAQRRLAVSGTRLNLTAIQIDSDGVFSVANAEAIRAGVSFDRLNYRLNADNQAGIPVWRVELFDGPSHRVGALKISADSAQVIELSPELALTEEQKRELRWSKPGEKYKSVPDFFHRIGKRAENTGYKLKNWANGYGWTDERDPLPPNRNP